jgi:hypothetical protein
MLCDRMRADLAVYLEAITHDGIARKGPRHDHQRVSRARLAYQAARTALVAHLEAHDVTMPSGAQLPLGETRPSLLSLPERSGPSRESGMRARRASA